MVVNLQAQSKRKAKLNLGFEVAAPATDETYKYYRIGLGGTIKALFPFKKQSYITATTGVINFSGRVVTLNQLTGIPINNFKIAVPSYTIVPLKIGYLTPFSAKSKWYAEAEVGYTYGDVSPVIGDYKFSDYSGITGAIGVSCQATKTFQFGWRYEAIKANGNIRGYGAFVSFRSMVNIDW